MIRRMATVVCVLGIVAAAAQAAPVIPNANGLIAYYLFDEAVSNGSTVTDGKGSKNGTAVGDTIESTTTTPFTYANNKAVSFNAGSGSTTTDDDYVQIPSSALDLKSMTGTYSISLWYKTTTTTKSNLVARAVSNAQYQILAQASGGVKATIGNSSDGQTTGVNYNNGNWHNVVVSMAAGTGKIYVDGLEGVTITAGGSGNINVAVDTLIGAKRPGLANTGSADAYTGLMDDVAFFNYALSADEAAWLTNNSLHTLVTPEPATLCLLALGGVFAIRGRRQHG